MSDAHDDLHGPAETSHSNFALSVIGAIGSLLLFGLIIFIAYYYPSTKMDPVMSNSTPPDVRLQRLDEMHAKEADVVDSYAVLNPKEGVVRIPVSRAMELIVPELNAEPVPAEPKKADGPPAK